MAVRTIVVFVFLLFLLSKASIVLGQDEKIFPDSTSFVDFLISQGEIPGLQFQLVNSSGQLLIDSTGETGSLAEFSAAHTLKNTIYQPDSVTSTIQYLIFSEPYTFEATQEYVSNLLRNGDIELLGNEIWNGKDLISLASKEIYTPLLSGNYFSYFADLKIFIVALTISLFLVFAVLMIVFMLVFKARRNHNEKLKALYDQYIVGPLSEILFEKTLEELESLSDEELFKNFPEKQLKKAVFEQVLVERIIALNKKMKGDFKLKLKALYKRLDLHTVSIKKLNSSKWANVVIGLVEINEMDLTEGLSEVKKHVNSPNFHIRSQAVATTLNLSDSVDLSFLRDQTFPLSRWQQMNYLRIIKFLNSSRELHINTLFSSENQSIRLFGYKLVRVLGLVDLLEELEEKFAAVSDEEKIEIIKAFEYLGVPAQSSMLNDSMRSDNVKLVTIAGKAAGAIGDDSNAKIIYEILETSPVFGLQLVLLRSLQNLNAGLYNQFITKDSDSDLQRINAHLLDPLLQDV
ncbi:hypothetical protein LV84_01965 [Algoriphagus ratkowskyi]|uniref:HEAT repeat domain-containing protein n=1 Tax=Algoriphagus ratkowskyi TaxID=57028 RepID=A0A2W7RQS3_9BACT|nr:hypothetical protein [Algoriphagus ratkowskyi]PZX56839.1 hypothetical protein LV84_01965 [Algoriphagus ratkowskyi]TXD79754.1 hypothetical protein ESW18_01080 [Algoriphagus ratkowskyi]